MTQEKIFSAYGIVNHMRKYSHTPAASYKLFKLNRTLKPVFDFQTEQRKKLLEKYPPKKFDGVNFEFNDAETATAFKQEWDELTNLESEIEIKPIQISLADLNNEMPLYPDDYEVLDGIIEFTEEDKNDDIKVEMLPVEAAADEE